MNLYLLHRDPRYFPDPSAFRPERFMGTDSTRHHFAYIPFSAGSRNCIGKFNYYEKLMICFKQYNLITGQRFAMMQLKIVLSEVLSSYRVNSPVPESELNLLGELVLVNQGGIQISLTPR